MNPQTTTDRKLLSQTLASLDPHLSSSKLCDSDSLFSVEKIGALNWTSVQFWAPQQMRGWSSDTALSEQPAALALIFRVKSALS